MRISDWISDVCSSDLLGDLILPADERSSGAGKLGVGAFVDEWISAPYPIQRHEREQVLGGLMWLDAQSRALHVAAFDAIPPAQSAALLDALTVPTPAASLATPIALMAHIHNPLAPRS